MFRFYYIICYPLTLVCLLLLSIYRAIIRYMLPSSCNYIPTCSKYAWDSIVEFGAIIGVIYSVKRLCRCRPNHTAGYDFVKLNLSGNYKWKC